MSLMGVRLAAIAAVSLASVVITSAATAQESTTGEIVMQARRLYRERRVVIHSISIGRTSELLQQLASDTGGRYVQR